jgi:molybdopterin-guanine dinucleotide biosynthesis protein A
VAFDAVILAGGHSARLGGTDKALVLLDGTTLLERAVDAVTDAGRVIVVGPNREVPVSVPVTWVQEDPPGGGPVAALATGLPLTEAELVVVLAVDHPLATSADVARLATSAEGDGAVAVDVEGRTQPLLAVYGRSALDAALRGLPRAHGASLQDVTAGLALAQIELGQAAMDCDTWEEFEAAGMTRRK